MLLCITEKCSMGCSHCIDNATPNGKHMTFETLEKALDFIIRNNVYHSIIVTGGETTEHPLFPMFMGYIIATLAKKDLTSMVTVLTNGFWLLENEENLKCAKQMVEGCKNVHVQFQISTDERFYPKKLDTTKRIWREKGFVLCKDCVEQIYPMGRAKTNNIPWQAKASKCFNIRALAKQLPDPTIESIVMTLLMKMKFCTPMIRIDGGISLGESTLCPVCASIYDKEEDIIQKIKDFKCDGCSEINDRLPMIYRQFVI